MSTSADRARPLLTSSSFITYPFLPPNNQTKHNMTTHHPRKFPVVLITGTPGCGKTLHSQVLAADSDVKMTHLNIGDIVKQHGFHNGFDEEWKSYIVDEDRLLDYLEEVVNPEDGAAETGK